MHKSNWPPVPVLCLLFLLFAKPCSPRCGKPQSRRRSAEAIPRWGSPGDGSPCSTAPGTSPRTSPPRRRSTAPSPASPPPPPATARLRIDLVANCRHNWYFDLPFAPHKLSRLTGYRPWPIFVWWLFESEKQDTRKRRGKGEVETDSASTTVALKWTQPEPAGGAVHKTWWWLW